MTTHSPIVVETLNNHLKRHKLGTAQTGDEQIDSVLPLANGEVRGYRMQSSHSQSLIDADSGLVDNTLLPYFNKINMLYDKMRYIEWNQKDD